jgi:hypothetical protein
MEQELAQLACNDLGGHLATFTSLEEQVDVEGYYINWGLMFPTYTPSYWIGAESAFDLWPTFYWKQRSFSGPTDGRSYNHFGADEPNNRGYQEYCTVANYTLNYMGANGWSDTLCTAKFPYMCRISGRLAAPPTTPARLPACRNPQQCTHCRSARRVQLHEPQDWRPIHAFYHQDERQRSRGSLQPLWRPPGHLQHTGGAAGLGALLRRGRLPHPQLPHALLHRLQGVQLPALCARGQDLQEQLHALGHRHAQPHAAVRARARQPAVPERLGLGGRALRRAHGLHVQKPQWVAAPSWPLLALLPPPCLSHGPCL